MTQDLVQSRSPDKAELVAPLLKHETTVKIPLVWLHKPDVNYARVVPYMATLLEHDPDLPVTGKVLSAIVCGGLSDEDMQHAAELLLRFEKKIGFDEAVQTAIDQNFQSHSRKHLRALFYKLERRDT